MSGWDTGCSSCSCPGGVAHFNSITLWAFGALVISLYFHLKKNTMSDQLKEFDNETGCPKCGSGIISPVKYTWWGGVLGPKLLHHTKCEVCGYRYNSKTRKPNTVGIIIYSAVLVVIVAALTLFLKLR